MDPAQRYKFQSESAGLGFAQFGFTQFGISQFSSFQSRTKLGNSLANFVNFKKTSHDILGLPGAFNFMECSESFAVIDSFASQEVTPGVSNE